jgi:tetratricopeptide (TPR) repeat protein
MKENLKNKNNINHKIKISSLIFSIIFSLFFGIFIQLFSLSVIASGPTTASGPVITFQEKSWDFGEIDSREIPSHTFILKNTGDELLIIERIKITCESCVDAQISNKDILPEESAELIITVNSLEMMGHFSKRIYLKSNDLNHSQVVIMVSGFIKNDRESNSTSKSKTDNNNFNNSVKDPYTTGISYFAKNEYEQAIPEFEKSIESDPNHTDSYYYLGQCYLQWGIIEYNKKHILKSYKLYRKANKIAEQVIPLYEKMIEDNPNDLNTFLKLGYIYEVKSIIPFIDEYEIALKYYLDALNLDFVSFNQNTGIYIYLNSRIGIISFQEKDYLQAISYLEKALEASPHQENAETCYYLGMSYVKIREKEKALDFLSKVIEFAPQSEFAQEAQKEIKKIKK